MKRLQIMAAGTGGHIFPGLAIAHTMQACGWEVTWLGTTHGMENTLIAPTNIPMDRIAFGGLRGKGAGHMLVELGKMFKSFLHCARILHHRKPSVVLGMGGYVTIPGGVMARILGIPLILINADANLLLSNRWLSPLATKVLRGLGDQEGTSPKTITGNPIRQDMLTLAPPQQRYTQRQGVLRLLVIGGSLGAKVLNEIIPEALAKITESTRPIVTHQSGAAHIDTLRATYKRVGIKAEVIAFINDMPQRYAQADLVICRAGAITVSELTAVGMASILIPFVASTTNHQQDNALWIAKHQAAIHVPQEALTPERMRDILMTLTREQCRTMAENAYQQGRRDAHHAIATVLEEAVH